MVDSSGVEVFVYLLHRLLASEIFGAFCARRTLRFLFRTLSIQIESKLSDLTLKLSLISIKKTKYA